MAHATVTMEDWRKHREELLVKEKAMRVELDNLAKLRQQLPWVEIDKEYTFVNIDSGSKISLPELFQGRKSLVVYHLMFDPEDNKGCPSCSMLADSLTGVLPHVNQKATLAVVCRGKPEVVKAFKDRKKNWDFPMYSSLLSDFNYDCKVSFQENEIGKPLYNYGRPVHGKETPGCSVFYKGDNGKIFLTYNTFARGLEAITNVFGILDVLPFGRQEKTGMDWVKHKEDYTQ